MLTIKLGNNDPATKTSSEWKLMLVNSPFAEPGSRSA